jgi:hypothetical protein
MDAGCSCDRPVGRFLAGLFAVPGATRHRDVAALRMRERTPRWAGYTRVMDRERNSPVRTIEGLFAPVGALRGDDVAFWHQGPDGIRQGQARAQ